MSLSYCGIPCDPKPMDTGSSDLDRLMIDRATSPEMMADRLQRTILSFQLAALGSAIVQHRMRLECERQRRAIARLKAFLPSP